MKTRTIPDETDHKVPKVLKVEEATGTKSVDEPRAEDWKDKVAFNVARIIRSDPNSGGPDFDLRAVARQHYDRLKLDRNFDEFESAVDDAYQTVRVKIGESPMRDMLASDFSSRHEPRLDVKELCLEAKQP